MSKKSIMYPYEGKGICHYGYAQIGGIKQYVQIRGSDRRSPVLLVIHGGPGSSLVGICHVMQDRWEQKLVVANYDQRGTSKTLMANPGREAEIGQTGSLEDHLSDVDGVHAIEEATFPKPWSRKDFVKENVGAFLGGRCIEKHVFGIHVQLFANVLVLQVEKHGGPVLLSAIITQLLENRGLACLTRAYDNAMPIGRQMLHKLLV